MTLLDIKARVNEQELRNAILTTCRFRCQAMFFHIEKECSKGNADTIWLSFTFSFNLQSMNIRTKMQMKYIAFCGLLSDAEALINQAGQTYRVHIVQILESSNFPHEFPVHHVGEMDVQNTRVVDGQA